MGLVAGTLSWRWAFASESLIIILLLYFAGIVKERPRSKTVRFDLVGALLTFTGLGLVVLGATLAGEFGWWQARRPFYVGDQVFAPLGLSAALYFIITGAIIMICFALWSNRRSHRDGATLFQMSLFKKRLYAGGVTLGFLFQVTVGGLLFVLPVFLQSALQLNALDTALVLLPYTLGMFVFALAASRLPSIISAHRIAQAGLVLMLAGGCWVYQTASLELAWGSLVPALFCFGAGAGLVLARMTEITLSSLTPDELGEGTGGDSTGKELGVAFGVSVLGSIFLVMVYGHVVVAYDAYHNLPEAAAEDRQQAIVELEDWASQLSDDQWQDYLASLPAETGDAYSSIVNTAYLTGYRNTLRILIVAIVAMILVSFWMRPSKVRSTKDSS